MNVEPRVSCSPEIRGYSNIHVNQCLTSANNWTAWTYPYVNVSVRERKSAWTYQYVHAMVRDRNIDKTYDGEHISTSQTLGSSVAAVN